MNRAKEALDCYHQAIQRSPNDEKTYEAKGKINHHYFKAQALRL